MAYRIIRLPDVVARTGRPPSTIYWLIKRGLFPPPIKLGPRTSGWPDSDGDAINAAYAAGRSDDEIRNLVKRLVAERTAPGWEPRQ